MLQNLTAKHAQGLPRSSVKRFLALPLALVPELCEQGLERALTRLREEGCQGTAGCRRIGNGEVLQRRLVRLKDALRLRIHKERHFRRVLEEYSVAGSGLPSIPVVPLKGVLGIKQLLLQLRRRRKATG
jgi:hypothetical protein